MTSKCAQLDSPGRRFDWKNTTKINISRFAPGPLFVNFCIALGASLGYLGPSWEPFCSPKASFWTILGISWVLLDHLDLSWSTSWSSWRLSWRSLDLSWLPLGCLGHHWRSPASTLTPQGQCLYFVIPFGNICGPTWNTFS